MGNIEGKGGLRFRHVAGVGRIAPNIEHRVVGCRCHELITVSHLTCRDAVSQLCIHLHPTNFIPKLSFALAQLCPVLTWRRRSICRSRKPGISGHERRWRPASRGFPAGPAHTAFSVKALAELLISHQAGFHKSPGCIAPFRWISPTIWTSLIWRGMAAGAWILILRTRPARDRYRRRKRRMMETFQKRDLQVVICRAGLQSTTICFRRCLRRGWRASVPTTLATVPSAAYLPIWSTK